MNTAIDSHNTITSVEASEIIEASAKTLMENPELAHSLPPILLRGAPGVGKSTIVKDIADKLGIGFVDIRLATMDPVDLKGLPVPNKEEKSVEWFVTSDLPRDPNSKGILFFDEITSADKSLQVAAYQLILDRCLGKLYKLPDGWFIVAAGNRISDRAVATSMSSALANRFAHFELNADAEDWNTWATSKGVHHSVTGFIRYRPSLLFSMENQNLEQGWPSPRSWERVSNVIPMFSNENTLRKMVYSLVGPGAGCEFMEFHKLNKKFDDALEVLTNPAKKVIIPERADEKHAYVSCIAYLLWNGKNDDETNARVDGLFRVLNELTNDFATLLIKQAMLGSKTITPMQAAMKIATNPAYKDFEKKFRTSFNAHAKI